MAIQPPSLRPAAQGPQPEIARARDLHRAARDLEAAFLAEMLKPMGAGAPRESFGGGAGEDQFASLLVDEEARAMARHGGIGLADGIYRALLARSGDRDDR